VVTRLIFDWLLQRGWLKSIRMLHFIRATQLDFMKLAKPAFITSWLLILVGVGYGFTRGKSAFGVDFLGGDSTTFKFEQRVPDTELRSAFTKAGIKDARIQYQRELGGGPETLRVDSPTGTSSNVVATLKQFPAAKFNFSSGDQIGATVGDEIKRSAIIASLLSLFGILVYVAFRYEFSFAVGAVLAVIHDVLMTIGWYCLAGREFNATTVAAILTIIGFSTNDTIVIFDRIREDLKLGMRGTFREVMNKALNQTLSRTIITSGTVFLATLSLYIFGGGAINDFAFTFLVGIITGTYSSIYIASALVLWWHKGQRPHIGSGPIAAVETAAVARS
jgi:SecD/SecF fusion protein